MTSKVSRRNMLRMMGLAGGATLLAACGQPEQVKGVEQEKEKSESVPVVEKKPVSYWTVDDLKGQQPMVDRFIADTGTPVDHSKIPLTAGTQASEKLLAAIAGGNPPDVAYFDRFLVASWAARDALTEIGSFADGDNVSKDDFLAHTWQEAVYCGKLFALPTTTDARALFVNTSHLKEAGISGVPKTWADLDTFQEALTKGNSKDGYTRLGIIPWYPWLEWMLYIWAMTGEGIDVWDFANQKCTVNTEPWLEAANWMTGYAKKYDVVAMEGFGSQFGPDAQDPFGNGLMSMMQNGGWMLFNYVNYFPDLEYDVLPMPGPASQTGRNLAGGWSVVIPKGAKNVDGGWEFIKNFTSEAYQNLYYRDNPKELVSYEIPTRVKVANDPKIAFASHPKAKAMIDTLTAQYIRPPIPEAQLLFEELGKATDMIVHLKAEPQAALEGVATKVNEAMSKWKCT